jgi:hypothetical protein
MKKFLFALLLCVAFTVDVKSQLTFNSLNLSQLATLLQGNRTLISNININCNQNAYAEYSGTSELPTLHGLLLTTGNASLAAGPDDEDGEGACHNSGATFSDPDLLVIEPDAKYDGCLLEFDCVPFGDTLQFKFCFGSEEYPEYVNASFNDAFGIFLTGPGGYNNTNIAKIPGTSTPVTIDNVNGGSNSNYYVNNSGGQYCQYDGFTIAITSTAPVSAGSSYHFKIAIADGGDCIYDSGLFIDAHSFVSDYGVGIASSNASGISITNDIANGTVAIRHKNPSKENEIFTLFDLNGRSVFSTELRSGLLAQTIQLSEFPAGVYISNVSQNGSAIVTQKVVIVR